MYKCAECQNIVQAFTARCPVCRGVSSLEKIGGASKSTADIVKSTDQSYTTPPRIITNQSDFDAILGGGIERGSVCLFAGDGGAGKSTLALQVAGSAAITGSMVLYVCGEEPIHRVQLRAKRVSQLSSHLDLIKTNDVSDVCKVADRYDLVVVDSIQVMHLEGKTNELLAASRLIAVAQKENNAVLLIGQVTKDGELAGANSLKHAVDTVLFISGSGEELRFLRAIKNRGGEVGDVAVFTMTSTGLRSVEDIATMFSRKRDQPIPGVISTIHRLGRRLVPLEIHVLLQADGEGKTRVSGLSKDRVEMMRAILRYHLGDKSRDSVYVSTVGGISAEDERSSDLAVLAALWLTDQRKPTSHLCVIGEVGLSGEIGQSPGVDGMMREARKHGYKVIAPEPGAHIEDLGQWIS